MLGVAGMDPVITKITILYRRLGRCEGYIGHPNLTSPYCLIEPDQKPISDCI
jgi:hypothetical protein